MKPQEKNLEKAPTLSGWLLLLLLALIWGSSYILIKKGLEAFSAEQVGALRITITALAFAPVFIYKYKEIDWTKLKYFLVVGIAGSMFPAFLFAFAQTKISSSLTGVLSSTTPLFTLLLGVLFFHAKSVWSKIVGVFIGLGGTIFLLLYGNEGEIGGNFIYGLLVVAGCLLYATSLNTVNAYLREVDPIITSAVSFIIIGIPTGIYLMNTSLVDTLTVNEHAWAALGYITLLALLGTFVATILFFRLVLMTNAVFASLVSYLIPIVALLWGFVDGEEITWHHLIGMILILSGVYISKK